ncbi:MAG: preprotein translocase subunit SecG [Vulcanimicrobiaceae bacterium]
MKPVVLAAAAKAPTVPASPHPLATPIQLQAAPVIAPHTWFQQHAAWLTHGIAGIFVICALALVVLLAVQTTKQEGLTGAIGGRVESTYKGRLGADEQLQRITGIVAVVFVIAATILSLTGI